MCILGMLLIKKNKNMKIYKKDKDEILHLALMYKIGTLNQDEFWHLLNMEVKVIEKQK